MDERDVRFMTNMLKCLELVDKLGKAEKFDQERLDKCLLSGLHTDGSKNHTITERDVLILEFIANKLGPKMLEMYDINAEINKMTKEFEYKFIMEGIDEESE